MKCVNGVPGAESNADDYGVTTILNMRNPQMAVDRWVMNGEFNSSFRQYYKAVSD